MLTPLKYLDQIQYLLIILIVKIDSIKILMRMIRLGELRNTINNKQKLIILERKD